MSDSSDDDEFDQLFDAFDQVDEENVFTASIATENIKERGGVKFDPFENRMTPEEFDQTKIEKLKNRNKRPAEAEPPRPTKRYEHFFWRFNFFLNILIF